MQHCADTSVAEEIQPRTSGPIAESFDTEVLDPCAF
jgi:hypothetical protein